MANYGQLKQLPLSAKACTKCREVKPLEEFYPRAAMRDGHRAECIACSRAVANKWRLDNLERHSDKTREWHKNNPDRRRELDRRSYEKNKEKRRADSRRWAQENPEHRRDYHLRKKYGITLEQYTEMSARQAHRCAICHAKEKEGGRPLAVDHDHLSGAIRGLLCGQCNRGIGSFGDDSERMGAAISYLGRVAA